MGSKVDLSAELAHHQEGESCLSSLDSHLTTDKDQSRCPGRHFENKTK